MNETQILDQLDVDLNTQDWFKDLLGQPATFTGFKLDKAYDSVPRTELTTAEAIAHRYKNRLTYVAATNVWYLWNGTIHVPCEDDGVALKVVQRYFSTVRDAIEFIKQAIELEVKAIKVSGVQDADKKAAAYRKEQDFELRKHKTFRDRISTDSTQSAIVRQMKRIMDVPRDHYEKDNNLFVVRNGVIDLDRFRAEGVPTLEAHDPARAVYRYFDADFDETAKNPHWSHFLSTSIIDAETAALLQKGVGAAFAATHKPRTMFNLLGAPASGKSLFLSVFDTLGQGYSVMPNNQAIQVNAGDTNFYQEALRGKRFVGFSEVQGKKALDDGFIKGIMGGDKQNTRTLNQREAAWIPQCVMFVASNMALKIDFRDEATFNKVLPIPFPWSFTDTDPEHKLDRELEDKVLDDRNGLLIWVLQGMKKFWEEGLHPTQAVMEAMGENKVASSYALQFMKELLDSGVLVQDLSLPNSSFVKMGDVYKAFGHWAEAQGAKNVTGKHTFNEDIKTAYFGDVNSGGRRFKGIVASDYFNALVVDHIAMARAMSTLDERLGLNS